MIYVVEQSRNRYLSDIHYILVQEDNHVVRCGL